MAVTFLGTIAAIIPKFACTRVMKQIKKQQRSNEGVDAQLMSQRQFRWQCTPFLKQAQFLLLHGPSWSQRVGLPEL